MKIMKSLYFWILIAFFAGSVLGILNPNLALQFEPLGTNFIKLIKIFVGPIVFLTVVVGIAQTGSLKKLGRIGIKAFIYFEIVSTLALLLGWAAAAWIKPGSMIHANIDLLDAKSVSHFLQGAEQLSFIKFLQNILPTNVFEPFIKGDMLQILFLAILFGVALLGIGENRAKNLMTFFDAMTQTLFRVIRMIMYVAPLGVFGAIAFAVAKFGVQFLLPLLKLILTFYLTSLVFVFVLLGSVAKLSGFSLWKFLKYIAPEFFLVLATSSSESALPQLIQKLEKLGCEQETVGVVVPLGYSFNMDGTNIYITLAALFIAQALGIDLTFTQELTLFAASMILSKGAAGVAGAGFITLAATLSVVPVIPAVGIVLILGIDRFMSEARSTINFIGNGVASVVISRWENEMTAKELSARLLK